MIEKKIRDQYETWRKKVTADRDLSEELKAMCDDDLKIENAFFRNLEFGTGGLRGVIGAGTNRMNVYTVAKASQGLSVYVQKKFEGNNRRIAVGYDNRIKSIQFAKVASEVFAANGIEVLMFSELMPTPCLSYAVRELKCSAGIMITASHNPSKYNGYKVYNSDGCQITTKAAEEILYEIEKLDLFKDVKSTTFDFALQDGRIQFISNELVTSYIEEVKQQRMLKNDDNLKKDVSIIYTPLNGTGLKPVLRVLKESGFTDITVVKEQEQPDGYFPTCPNPNPEIPETMALGIVYAKRKNADLILATDPDCDRVGIAIKNQSGEYDLISGNETGLLLLDYICHRHLENGTMPHDAIMVKTIVTTDMAERVASHYGVKTINVLTGFKYIGEQIGLLEARGMLDSYVFGFEESYGYLSGTYVRDKDAVVGALLICEMFVFYRSKGIGLLDKLDELYKHYGYNLNTLISYEFEGSEGFAKMQQIMQKIRNNFDFFGSSKVEKFLDYSDGLDELPKSNVIKIIFEDNSSIVVRPSGTEPKLKAYLSINALNKQEAKTREQNILEDLKCILAL